MSSPWSAWLDNGGEGDRTLGSDFPVAPFLVGLPGSEAFSLISEKLVVEGRRALPLLPLCWNLTFVRDLAMASSVACDAPAVRGLGREGVVEAVGKARRGLKRGYSQKPATEERTRCS